MTDTKLLEQAIEASGYKKKFIAEQLGLSVAGLYNLINNKAEFKVSQINAICDLLSIEQTQRNAIFFAQSGA